MRAVIVTRSGGPEVLELTDRPDPSPGPGQLVVRVAAAGVNYMDVYGRSGRPPYAAPTPFVLGAEGAGTVLSVGAGVTSATVGDVVAWAGAPGSYAEQVVVDAERAVPVPAGVGADLAAALMLQGLTAHYLSASCYPVAAGDVVVVHAAAGGVGLLLTQLVTARGGTVVATASSEEKRQLARTAGATFVTDYDGLDAAVREASGGAGAHVVYDSVGATTFDTSLTALRPRGLLVLYGAASGPVPPFELQRLSAGGSLYVTRPTLGSYTATREELLGRAGELFDAVLAGRLDVRVGGRYPLDDVRSAHEDLEARRTTGKLLLLP